MRGLSGEERTGGGEAVGLAYVTPAVGASGPVGGEGMAGAGIDVEVHDGEATDAAGVGRGAGCEQSVVVGLKGAQEARRHDVYAAEGASLHRVKHGEAFGPHLTSGNVSPALHEF